MNETLTNESVGFINKTHADEITETFGAEMAAKMMETADENTTFLGLLFQDWTEQSTIKPL